MTFLPVSFSRGLMNAAVWASPLAPPKLTMVRSRAWDVPMPRVMMADPSVRAQSALQVLIDVYVWHLVDLRNRCDAKEKKGETHMSGAKRPGMFGAYSKEKSEEHTSELQSLMRIPS